MSTRTYGRRYDRDRDVADDARLIRAEIAAYRKAAIIAADWTYRVRTERFAGGASITIAATSPRPIYACDPDTARAPTVHHRELDRCVSAHQDRHTIEASATLAALHELHAAYNHDGSDPLTGYSDVKFYGHVRLATAAGVPEWATTTDTPATRPPRPAR
jgi:hypothetical protein